MSLMIKKYAILFTVAMLFFCGEIFSQPKNPLTKKIISIASGKINFPVHRIPLKQSAIVLVYFTKENGINTATILNKDIAAREFQDSVAVSLPIFVRNLDDSVFNGGYVLPIIFQSLDEDEGRLGNTAIFNENLMYLFDDIARLKAVRILWPFFIVEESVRHIKD